MTIQMGSSAARNHHRDFSTPTQNQLAALTRYAEDTTIPAPVRFGIRHYLESGQITYAEASDTIGMIKKFLKSETTVREKVTEEGIYFDSKTEAFFLVRRSQLDKLYAMDLVIHDKGERAEDGSWIRKPKFQWIFQPGKGLIFKLSADMKATAEQCKKWGDLTGHCIKCHSELTRQDSIERGMGKTCWERSFG